MGQHEKLFTWRKNILPKWDLIFVEVRSHLDGMNQFSYKKLVLQSEIHHSAEISLRWDVSPGWDDFSHINSSWCITKRFFKESISGNVTSTQRALGYFRHSKGTSALGHLRHSGTRGNLFSGLTKTVFWFYWIKINIKQQSALFKNHDEIPIPKIWLSRGINIEHWP